MRDCIPDELLNSIPYPTSGLSAVGIDDIVQEIRYKIPVATDVMVRKEVWHTVCDFCTRLGALLDRAYTKTVPAVTDEDGNVTTPAVTTDTWLQLSSQYGRFQRVVGVTEDGESIHSGFSVNANASSDGIIVSFSKSARHAVVFSVQPSFAGTGPTNGTYDPKVPKWFLEKYGECIMHGALMRLFAMPQPWGDAGLAKMHGTAYNNDLTKFSFGLITSGMRKHLLVDVEDMVVSQNGNG